MKNIRNFIYGKIKTLSAITLIACIISAGPAAYAFEAKPDGTSKREKHVVIYPGNYIQNNTTSDKYSLKAGNLAAIKVLIDGNPARIYNKNGNFYIEGTSGCRYSLLITNLTNGRIKAVCSVDGLDVIDGKTASYDKSGYVIPAYSYVNIKGFRISDNEVATFRFGPIEEAYAMKLDQPQNIGKLGFAFFSERQDDYIYSPEPPLYYGGRKYDETKGVSKESANKSQSFNLNSTAERTPSIGTEFGERRNSSVTRTEFVEKTASPEIIAELNYGNHEDLLNKGVFNHGYDYIINEKKPEPENNLYSVPPSDWKFRNK